MAYNIFSLFSLISNNLTNYGRRHFKLFTNWHVSWDTLYMLFYLPLFLVGLINKIFSVNQMIKLVFPRSWPFHRWTWLGGRVSCIAEISFLIGRPLGLWVGGLCTVPEPVHGFCSCIVKVFNRVHSIRSVDILELIFVSSMGWKAIKKIRNM